MPTITLLTEINAPVAVCFNLARSIDLHITSTAHTGEQAIAGRTTGLIGLNETVTWRAKHFGIWQTLTSKITQMHAPYFFADEMTEGIFKLFRHEHYFAAYGNMTVMKDVFVFESPLGLLGKLANVLFVKRYLTRLLQKRNEVIKQCAERQLL